MPRIKSELKPLETEFKERKLEILNLKKDLKNVKLFPEEKKKKKLLLKQKKYLFNEFKFSIPFYITNNPNTMKQFLKRWKTAKKTEFSTIKKEKAEWDYDNEEDLLIDWMTEKTNSKKDKKQQKEIWHFFWEWFKNDPKIEYKIRKSVQIGWEKVSLKALESRGSSEEEETKQGDEEEEEESYTSYLENEEILEKTKQIYGIVYLHILYSKKFNQVIYLFGEHHLKYLQVECESKSTRLIGKRRTYIREYLQSLIQYFGFSFFDFYLERPLLLEDKQLQPLQLRYEAPNINNLVKVFKGCLEIVPEQPCRFLNIRVHAVDARVRNEFGSRNKFFAAVKLFLQIYDQCRSEFPNCKINEKDIQNKIGTNWRELLHPIEKKKNGKYKKSEIKKFFEVDENSKVIKEINLVDEKKFSLDDKKITIKNILLDELLLLSRNLYNAYEDTQTTLYDAEDYILGNKTFDLSLVDKIWIDLRNIYELMINASAETMDFYTLARIFHFFRPKNPEKPLDFPFYATNIIYYAGKGHSIYTQDLLVQMGFTEVFAQENKDDKACVIAPPLTLLERLMI